jgi:hypothetical protein
MYPLHDKDLDRLSRNAAEHYEMDFGSSGWEQLEKRLDQELPQKKDRRRFLFWLFFIVVTTGGALTALLINSQPVRPLVSSRINAGATKAATDGRHTNRPNIKLNNASPENQAVVPDKKEVPPIADKVNTPASNHTAQAPISDEPVRRKRSANKTIANRSNRSFLPVQSGISSGTPLQVESDDLSNTIPQVENKPVDSNATTSKPAATDSVAKTTDENKKPPIPHRYKQPLELGLVAGPDASMVSFGPLYKAGYNFGVSIGYRFNNRWSINTGAIYTRKYYQADSNSFHAPKRSYISYVDLDVLKGYCAMWDIPLNVRYDISFNDKRRFFASAGASTYFMKEQSYSFWYWQRGTGDYKEDYWGPGSDTQYVFSVLNLSVGYERMISKHFSIQAEPYFKIPLKGLGYGTMKIGSYGMFFSLKYRPTFKAKQPAGRK